MDLPTHPDQHDETQADHPTSKTNWAVVAVFAIGGALLALVILLHLTGVVGPGAH